MIFVRNLAIALALTLLGQSARAEILTSTFDTNAEGWTSADSSITYVANNGNPGGYINVRDESNLLLPRIPMTVVAPSLFHGDLSRFLNGTISFDSKNLNSLSPNDPIFGTITIGSVSFSSQYSVVFRDIGPAGSPAADGQWHTYSASLNPSSWTPDLGTALLGNDLSDALKNVNLLTVTLESHQDPSAITGREQIGFDNFRLETRSQVPAVPVPAGVVLLGIGSLSLGMFRRFQKV